MICFSFQGRGELTVFLPQASEEYGPISHYYLVVIPNSNASSVKYPDQYGTVDLVANSKGNNANYARQCFRLGRNCFVICARHTPRPLLMTRTPAPPISLAQPPVLPHVLRLRITILITTRIIDVNVSPVS